MEFRNEFGNKELLKTLLEQITEIQKMLTGFMNRLT